MRRYLVTSIVALVAFVGGIGAHTLLGESATAKTARTRTYRCISQVAHMSVSAYNLSPTKPATIKIRTLDANNNVDTPGDAVIQPDHSNAILVDTNVIFVELRTKGRLLVTGVASDVTEGDDSLHTVRCT